MPKIHVCIDLSGTYTVMLSSDATIDHLTVGTGGSGDGQTLRITGVAAPGLTVTSGLTIEATGRLRFSDQLSVAGSMDVRGTLQMDATASVLSGSGTATVFEGGTALLRGTLDGRDVINLGTTDIADFLTLSNDAQIDNRNLLILSGATRTLSGDGRVFNSDTTRKVGGLFFEVQVPFVNDGVVDVQDGSLTIQDVFDNNTRHLALHVARSGDGPAARGSVCGLPPAQPHPAGGRRRRLFFHHPPTHAGLRHEGAEHGPHLLRLQRAHRPGLDEYAGQEHPVERRRCARGGAAAGLVPGVVERLGHRGRHSVLHRLRVGERRAVRAVAGAHEGDVGRLPGRGGRYLCVLRRRPRCGRQPGSRPR